jgi:hypothetical protein
VPPRSCRLVRVGVAIKRISPDARQAHSDKRRRLPPTHFEQQLPMAKRGHAVCEVRICMVKRADRRSTFGSAGSWVEGMRVTRAVRLRGVPLTAPRPVRGREPRQPNALWCTERSQRHVPVVGISTRYPAICAVITAQLWFRQCGECAPLPWCNCVEGRITRMPPECGPRADAVGAHRNHRS